MQTGAPGYHAPGVDETPCTGDHPQRRALLQEQVMRAPAWIVMVAGLSSGLPGEARAAAPVKATMADVAFIAGHWKGTAGTGLSEEIWTAPAGDNMAGLWRLVDDGQVKLFEFLNIVQEADGPVFRLRHFDRHGVGWEEKDKPLVLKLTSWKPREATFEGRDIGDTGTLRLVYRRTSDDAMTVTLEKPNRPPQDFTFHLAAAMK
jgi:hypothetical protein